MQKFGGGGGGLVQTRCIMGYVQVVNLGETCPLRLASFAKNGRSWAKNQVVKYGAFSKNFFC